MENKRKQVSILTYNKIKNLFNSNPLNDFTATEIRDKLNLDYDSVKFVLDLLIQEDEIGMIGTKYIKKKTIDLYTNMGEET